MESVAILNTYKDSLTRSIQDLDNKELISLSKLIFSQAKNKRKIFIVGNGGSSATASHFVCDLQKTVLGKNPKKIIKNRIAAICLNDNVPLITAWGNDESYSDIFSQPLINIGRENDLLIVITGSGNSENIIEVLKIAQKMKIKTFGLLGFDGGMARKLCDNSIIVNSNHYGIIEDMHAVIMHMLTELLKEYYK